MNNGLFDESLLVVSTSALNSFFHLSLSVVFVVVVEHILGVVVAFVIDEDASTLFLTDLHFFIIAGDDRTESIVSKFSTLFVDVEKLYISNCREVEMSVPYEVLPFYIIIKINPLIIIPLLHSSMLKFISI